MKKVTTTNTNLLLTISLSLIAILLLSTSFLTAPSEVKMSGKIMYADQTAVDDAVISVLDITDRSLITSEVSQVDGTFKFKELKSGKYFISIQLMDQPAKIYGPITIGEKKEHLVLKTVYMPNAAAKVVTKSTAFNS